MKKVPEEVLQDWVKNKKRILDRLNRIKKRLKKYNKQLLHYEMRARAIKQYEQEQGKLNDSAHKLGLENWDGVNKWRDPNREVNRDSFVATPAPPYPLPDHLRNYK